MYQPDRKARAIVWLAILWDIRHLPRNEGAKYMPADAQKESEIEQGKPE